MRKKKVLWMGEATFLKTGYGVLGKEVLSRLHDTGKYEIAEMGSYGHPSAKEAQSIPWKYYGCMPEAPHLESQYRADMTNQWGKWRFEDICLDFQPDVVCEMRDVWVFEWQSRSPFRDKFHWAIMPTIDSAPQMESWNATYMNADSVCAYAEFGRDTMMEETGGRINFCGIPSPAADYEIFKPVADKAAHKDAMGFDKDIKIVGTIMRNQKRKLFPDLIEAFKIFVEKLPKLAKNTYLYLHTYYPDIGWDIPRLIKESGIAHKILCTYICHTCDKVFPSFFHDAIQTCPKCGNPTARMSHHTKGASPKDLSAIINCFDVYVQYSCSEGFGLPQCEAAACAVPVMSVDCTAMSSVVRNLKGTPIKVKKMFREAETHCFRAYPDNEDLAEKLGRFLAKPESLRYRAGRDTYLACRSHYSWDKSAKIWEGVIDGASPKLPWNAPPRILEPNLNIPPNLPTDDFVKWGIANIWGEPSQVNSYIALRMTRDLNYGESIIGYGGPYYAEDSLLSTKQKFKTYKRQDAVEQLIELANTRNYWEKRRCGMIQEEVPTFIKIANGR